MNRPLLTNILTFDNKQYKITFFDGKNVEQFLPYTQSYGVCFTEDGKIVIGRHEGGYTDWHLSGGTIEKGEHPNDTLRRELYEELTLEVIKFELLGAQLVEPISGDKGKYYQLRYVALVKLHPLQIDPDKGIYWERKLVTPEEFLSYVKWGNIGKHLLIEASKIFIKWKENKEI